LRIRLGECLLQAGLITDGDLRRAIAEQQRSRERLGAVLVRLAIATERQIAEVLALQLGFPFVDLSETPPDPAALTLISRDLALAHLCVGVRRDTDVLTVATAEPLRFGVLQDLELESGYRLEPVIATREQILSVIEQSYSNGSREQSSGAPPTASSPLTEIGERDAMPSIEEILQRITQSATSDSPSDIHIDPMNTGGVVRYRVAGVLTEAMKLPASIRDALAAHVKTMAGLDPSELRQPQSGRLRLQDADGSPIDVRVSTLRTVRGEKVVMRLLRRRPYVPALDALGMSAMALQAMREMLGHHDGLILFTAPRGSGKTTALQSVAAALQSTERNIVTIVDPIEYELPGVHQSELQTAPGVSSALRQALLNDPDVVVVGDICDSEAAIAVVQAAQTGPLILAGMCSDDAVSAPAQLASIGVESAFLAPVLRGVVAMRLVRRLCVHCRRQHTASPETARSLGINDDPGTIVFFEPAGCDQCDYSGYRGRIGLFEVMRVTDALRGLIASRAPLEQIRDQAIAGGVVTLAEDGLSKARNGVTTVAELRRTVPMMSAPRPLCAHCGEPVRIDFNACPACGTRVAGACPHCGRAIQSGWRFCPFCARSVHAPTAGQRIRERDRVAQVANFKKSGHNT